MFIETPIIEENELATDLDNSSVTTYETETAVDELPNSNMVAEDHSITTTQQSLSSQCISCCRQ